LGAEAEALMARPTKLTPEVAEPIVAAIRAGSFPEPAARSAGVSPATYYRWKRLGREQASGSYRDFVEAIRRAEGEAEVHAIAVIRKQMPGDWRAALAYLERRHSERWGRRAAEDRATRRPRTRRGGIDLRKLTDEELAELRRIHQEARARE
jgi:hypothetical protein